MKISDFGVARALDTIAPRAYPTMTGTAVGTPAYMSPEQALGEPPGPACDLYALGVIVWEARAGQPPFENAGTPLARLYQKTHQPIPRISNVVPDVDPALARWLDVALARTPSHRFVSATAAWNDLEDAAIGLLGPRWRREARISLEIVDAPELGHRHA